MTAAVLRGGRELVAAREAEIARFEAGGQVSGAVEEIPAVVYADEGGEEPRTSARRSKTSSG